MFLRAGYLKPTQVGYFSPPDNGVLKIVFVIISDVSIKRPCSDLISL